MSQTNERAFETYVEEILLNKCWKFGANAEWDKEKAFYPAREEMQKLHGAGLEPLLITTLVKELDAKGSLHVLRHGFKFYGRLSGWLTSNRRTGRTTRYWNSLAKTA